MKNNRAERRRLLKLHSQLNSGAGHVALNHAVERAVMVLQRDFGFGETRIKRFLDGMMGE